MPCGHGITDIYRRRLDIGYFLRFCYNDAMKVILIKDVAKVGQHGTVKEVADGYALNFLIARGLAIQATPEKMAAHEMAQKREVEARERDHVALVKAIQSLEGARVEITARATEKGGLLNRLQSAISQSDLEQKGIKIQEEVIVLQKPIKQTGESKITLALPDVKITLAVIASSKITSAIRRVTERPSKFVLRLARKCTVPLTCAKSVRSTPTRVFLPTMIDVPR